MHKTCTYLIHLPSIYRSEIAKDFFLSFLPVYKLCLPSSSRREKREKKLIVGTNIASFSQFSSWEVMNARRINAHVNVLQAKVVSFFIIHERLKCSSFFTLFSRSRQGGFHHLIIAFLPNPRRVFHFLLVNNIHIGNTNIRND